VEEDGSNVQIAIEQEIDRNDWFGGRRANAHDVYAIRIEEFYMRCGLLAEQENVGRAVCVVPTEV